MVCEKMFKDFLENDETVNSGFKELCFMIFCKIKYVTIIVSQHSDLLYDKAKKIPISTMFLSTSELGKIVFSCKMKQKKEIDLFKITTGTSCGLLSFFPLPLSFASYFHTVDASSSLFQ